MLILHVRFTVDSLVRDFKFDMMTFLNRTQKRDFQRDTDRLNLRSFSCNSRTATSKSCSLVTSFSLSSVNDVIYNNNEITWITKITIVNNPMVLGKN